ncbi:hypothetical protein GCM10009735_86210 [Actinomadura chokoriensis]
MATRTASSIPRPNQDTLKSLEGVHRRENLCICGPFDTGKSHFSEPLDEKSRDHLPPHSDNALGGSWTAPGKMLKHEKLKSHATARGRPGQSNAYGRLVIDSQ